MEDANDIYGNSDWEIYNRTSDTVRAEFNYWGTIEQVSILARIYDYEDGYIDYVPWVNAGHDTEYESGQLPVADAGGPYTGDEGSAIVFSGSGSTDDQGIASWEWDLNEDGVYDSTGESTGYVWPDDCVATVVLRVTDVEGLMDTDTASVVVSNVPPSADAGGPYAAVVGHSIELVGTASDPGLDTLAYEWDLDEDGEFDDATVLNPSYTWTSPGVYTVGLRVMDEDGGMSADSAMVTISEESPSFIRADANADREVTMADVLFTVRYIYIPGSPVPPSMKAADTDDDGEVQMSDIIYTLRYVYIPGSPEPPYPFPDCGSDPSPDDLDYGSHPCMDPGDEKAVPGGRRNE
jgi:PKD repeat protein